VEPVVVVVVVMAKHNLIQTQMTLIIPHLQSQEVVLHLMSVARAAEEAELPARPLPLANILISHSLMRVPARKMIFHPFHPLL
jgi:hypothetical protein